MTQSPVTIAHVVGMVLATLFTLGVMGGSMWFFVHLARVAP